MLTSSWDVVGSNKENRKQGPQRPHVPLTLAPGRPPAVSVHTRTSGLTLRAHLWQIGVQELAEATEAGLRVHCCYFLHTAWWLLGSGQHFLLLLLFPQLSLILKGNICSKHHRSAATPDFAHQLFNNFGCYFPSLLSLFKTFCSRSLHSRDLVRLEEAQAPACPHW